MQGNSTDENGTRIRRQGMSYDRNGWGGKLPLDRQTRKDVLEEVVCVSWDLNDSEPATQNSGQNIPGNGGDDDDNDDDKIANMYWAFTTCQTLF